MPTSTGNILRPPQQLVGFARVELSAGQSRTVFIAFPTSTLAVTPGDIDGTEPRQVLPGSYDVQVGSESAGFVIH
jgi:hypothetical protein